MLTHVKISEEIIEIDRKINNTTNSSPDDLHRALTMLTNAIGKEHLSYYECMNVAIY